MRGAYCGHASCARTQRHGQSNARRTVSRRYLSLRKTSGRQKRREALPEPLAVAGKRERVDPGRPRATHQLFDARPIKRSLYDSATRRDASRRRTAAATNAEYCVSTRARESAAVHRGRPMLSAPIAFSGACCRAEIRDFRAGRPGITLPFARSRQMS